MAPLRIDPDVVDVADAQANEQPDRRSAVGRARVLVMVTLGPLVTGYAAVAALLALITAVTSRAHFSTAGVLTAALPGWLAAHQVPVRIEGDVLGVLPLLPTIAAVMLLARTAAGAAARLDLHTPKLASKVVLAMTGGHAVFGLVLALLCGGGPVTADPLAAFCYPALLSGAAALAGIARYSGLLEQALERIDHVALRGLRAGVFAVVALLAAGAFVLALGLVTSVPAIREMFARNGSGAGSGLGLLLLSAGYLPNGVLAGTSFVAGPGFRLGEISVTPLNVAGGSPPPVPLLAALPEAPAAWWPVLLALPIMVGVLVGRLLRDVADAPVARLRAVAVATGVVALCLLILAGSAGGPLGGGRFDPVDLRAATLSVVLVAWIGLVGAAVAWFAGPRMALDGPRRLPDGPAEDPHDDEGFAEPEPADMDTESGDGTPDLPEKID